LIRKFRCSAQCYNCLEELVAQTVAMSTQDDSLQQNIFEQAMESLENEFSLATIPALLATRILRKIKMQTGCRDPFLQKKIQEMKEGRNVLNELDGLLSETGFERLLQVAALANTIDHFHSPDELVKALGGDFSWAVYDGETFLHRVKRGVGPFLYLADNAGEFFLDLPLFRKISSYISDSYYVVKGSPIQNDLALEDVQRCNLKDLPRGIITHGLDTVGLDVKELGTGFRELYESAALILAKGMGHFETLGNLEQRGRTLFVLKAKCDPVALSLGVSRNDYAAFLQ
jgi:damage-control phosphatase, subfamily I